MEKRVGESSFDGQETGSSKIEAIKDLLITCSGNIKLHEVVFNQRVLPPS